MKNYKIILILFLLASNMYAQKRVGQLKAVQESKSEDEFGKLFFTNITNVTISAISSSQDLRKIEQTALQYGIDLKLKEYIKSNKIYELTLEIKNGNETISETFSGGNIPLNKIDIELYKNGNPEASPTEIKTSLTIKKDRNNRKNGNEPRVLFSQ